MRKTALLSHRSDWNSKYIYFSLRAYKLYAVKNCGTVGSTSVLQFKLREVDDAIPQIFDGCPCFDLNRDRAILVGFGIPKITELLFDLSNQQKHILEKKKR
jgi:hypothetical protein